MIVFVRYMRLLSLLYDCDVAQVGRFGGEVKEASGAGLLVGAPYAGLGLANFGKVVTKQMNICSFCLPGLLLQLKHRIATW